MLRFNRHGVTFIMILALEGCINLAPDYQRPASDLPSDWKMPEGQSATTLGATWWKIFDDPQLTRMVDEALAHNANLAVAVARVDEARALLGETRSGQFPTLDATYSRDRTQSSLRTATPLPPGAARQRDNYRGTLNLAYELDLWGRLRNATAAARSELLATEAVQVTVRIALAADVVQAYFALRSLDEQVAATQRSVISRGESLALQKKRYDAGVISEFEYLQLEAEELAARAQLPALESRRTRQENALAVLLGRSPRAIYTGVVVVKAATMDAPAKPQQALVVPVGLPSELLLRRPDLFEAEQHMIAANARIGVARAAYFPSLSITGFFGGESAAMSDLFTGPAGTWQAAGALTQPIWNFGRVGSQVDAASARQRQALAQYQLAIQNAFREVRDAIVAQTKTREQFDAEDKRAATLRETLRLAKLRYRSGISSQLDVLDAERNLLAAELNRSDALRAQRAAVADLFKALGGGWNPGS
ncbi:MAG: efflux transporter outer membrane subunit [Sulfuricaulis sp.]|uniref:efflux transporter outer membrane subunit n=1 Tax=Sulfuricaulis sp. TaxID=2003553 RepID=UPI0025E62249|nr:efflux transporter outer membrane subunit [Sulfuricaulis sp.]MCR4346470.1 efflux transporter outer membrane subunit [Sulfuricaulis sp.]